MAGPQYTGAIYGDRLQSIENRNAVGLLFAEPGRAFDVATPSRETYGWLVVDQREPPAEG